MPSQPLSIPLPNEGSMSAKESQSKPVPRHSLLVEEEDANPTITSSKNREHVEGGAAIRNVNFLTS